MKTNGLPNDTSIIYQSIAIFYCTFCLYPVEGITKHFQLGGITMKRQFEVNDRYRPIVTIKKIKKKVPTVIEVSGRRYVHDNADTYKGGKRK